MATHTTLSSPKGEGFQPSPTETLKFATKPKGKDSMISLILVMVCAIAAGWLANRIQVPYPIVLVLAGIGLGVLYDWPELQLDPHLVLAIVLPAVLYPAALDTSWRDFRLALRPILLLSIGLVATTTLAVGVAFRWFVPQA